MVCMSNKLTSRITYITTISISISVRLLIGLSFSNFYIFETCNDNSLATGLASESLFNGMLEPT